MKKLLLVLLMLPMFGFAQRLAYPLPVDANNNPIMAGVGLPYAFTLTPTTSSYSASIQYQVPKTGNDAKRAYRHIMVYNPDTARTVYICFGSASACSTDNVIVPPGLGVALDFIRFGDAVDFPYVWARLDASGSVAATLAVW